ncbi:hypothetical protein [Streptomyces sp. MI02-7b]|uniref:hypothetical protein n=1 Tax=Streptomyces sp. MI02-7b TaxID=462941 RepID=UPI0029AC7DF1|nr:hypothetical protein [Streptomyces sp. MI02-7b]MDX3071188.1 hypothetical protein [Streptomyces sp. MI02-7b]
MSVYTPQQFGQQQPYAQQFGQQAWGQQQPWASQQGLGQQAWGQQHGAFQQYGQYGNGQGQQQLPLLVTEVALRSAATAVSAVVEQMRVDPQIAMGIQAQGQIPPHAWSAVVTECARRVAPVVHAVLAQNCQGQQGQQYGQFGQFGQGNQAAYGQHHFGQPQYGYAQMSPVGI